MSPTQSGRPPSPSRQYLFDLTLHGIKLGLDNIQALLDAAANPQWTYPTVHVGGTNGKGSVVAILAAMLSSAGYRVGRFTSPHLIDVSERFLINGVPIPERALEENIAYFRGIAETMRQCPTFFEMNTAIAFRYFAQEKVDIALIEVGMGGRFDSTNVVRPLATAITNISLEHTAYLGDTITAIAGEKAGIIKTGIPIVTAAPDPEALVVFKTKAAQVGAPLSRLGKDFDYRLDGEPWKQCFSYESPTLSTQELELSLPGRYQGANAAVAVALAEKIQPEFPRLSTTAIESGLRNASWPCRMERVLDIPPVIIDVAHNVAGIQRLAEVFHDCVVVFAASSDKDVAGMLAALRPFTHTLIISQFEGKRAASLDGLASCLEPGTYHTCNDLSEAIDVGIQCSDADRPLLITGSIYTAGEARSYLMNTYGASLPVF